MAFKIHPLTLSMLKIDQSQVTLRTGLGEKIWISINMWFIEGSKQNIIVDTGATAEQLQNYLNLPTKPIMCFEDALAKVDLTPDKIDLVIQTHLHHDHCANTSKCVNAKIIVQEDELRFAYFTHPVYEAIYDRKLLEDSKFIILKGNAKIMDGIEVLYTPGHSPGSQSVVIETDKGKTIIAGFCSVGSNFNPPDDIKKRFPVIAPQSIDVLQAYDSTLMVKWLADIIIPLHDPAMPDPA